MRVRGCNWRCYEAVSKECRCQCNGVNHGVGEAQARENFRRLGLLWKTPTFRRLGFRKVARRCVSAQQQLLFPAVAVMTDPPFSG